MLVTMKMMTRMLMMAMMVGMIEAFGEDVRDENDAAAFLEVRDDPRERETTFFRSLSYCPSIKRARTNRTRIFRNGRSRSAVRRLGRRCGARGGMYPRRWWRGVEIATCPRWCTKKRPT